MKLTKGCVIGILAAVAVLAAVFWYGGSAPGSQGGVAQKPAETAVPTPQTTLEGAALPGTATPGGAETLAPSETVSPSDTPAPEGTTGPEETTEPRPTEGPDTAPEGGSSAGAGKDDGDDSAAQSIKLDPATGKDKYLTGPVPEGKPLPVEPETVTISDTAYTCTLSVRCDTILDNLDWLDPEKVELVPEDGVILPATQVTFYEGESVFNVLQREMKKAKIHMEFVNTPIYHSAYIEGIGNLYEFDCGELSGWVYKVNDWFPNYGCSRYALKDGDVVEWVYTCDLGADVGGSNSTGG